MTHSPNLPPRSFEDPGDNRRENWRERDTGNESYDNEPPRFDPAYGTDKTQPISVPPSMDRDVRELPEFKPEQTQPREAGTSNPLPNPEKSPSRMKELLGKTSTKIGVVAAALTLLAGGGVAIAKAAGDTEHTPNDDTATEDVIDHMPSDELSDKPAPSSEVEQPQHEYPNYPALTPETATISVEGIESKEEMVEAVVDNLSLQITAGATEENFERYQRSNQTLTEFSANIAHETRLTFEEAHPSLVGLLEADSQASLDVIEELGTQFLREYFERREQGNAPHEARFVLESIEDIESLDKAPVGATTVTVSIESNGPSNGDAYQFQTNMWGVDANGETIYDLENNTEEGKVLISNISNFSPVEAEES